VASETVVAHVRKATQGTISVLNCHPFQHGRWVFAHNGDIPTFSEHRSELVHAVDARLRRFIFGDTDSEVYFFLVLSELLRLRPLSQAFSAEEVAAAVRSTMAFIRKRCDAEDDVPGKRALLTCLLTDGSIMVGAQGGKELYASTYKRSCPERDSCASYGASCEAPSTDGRVNHLVFASEPLGGHNVFEPLSEGDVLAIDGDMRLYGTGLRPGTTPSVAPRPSLVQISR
jgi:glutamine amidotransferase